MKKVLWYLVILVAVISFMVMGCAPTSAPQPPSSTQPVQTPAPAAPVAKITLKLGHDTNPASYFGVASNWWAEEVTKRTEGRVTVEVYPNSTLAAQAKSLDYLRAGMADVYVVSISTHAKSFPLSSVDSLPGIGAPTTYEGRLLATNTFMSILNKYPAVADEWKEFKIISYYSGSNFHLLTKDKEVHTPADLKGMKIGSLGLRQNFMELCGATPVMDIPPQAYEKLQTGVTQGTCVDWTATFSFQLWEVVKYFTEVYLGGNGLPLTMSLDSWKKISAADQKILLDVGLESQKPLADSLVQRTQAGKDKFLAAAGHSVIQPTADELKQWQQAYATLWEKWISTEEAAGRKDARAVLDEWRKVSK
jgi:TRAP-type C4-dicarboxylate transport system substrate-binding protein